MGIAVVTGASSGIGASICEALLTKEWIVFGIGRDFFGQPKLEASENFREIRCDLGCFNEVEQAIRRIKDEARDTVQLLVNCAGVGYFGPHEQISAASLHEMVAVNLETPLILTGAFLRDMKKTGGTIINISSVTAKKTNTHGCAYGATKAGLTSFGESLFDEARKYGVRVANIHPDMTASNFYRNADFEEGEEEDTYLNPSEVAACVMDVLHMRHGAAITDITIKPQRHVIRRKK